jgi:KUP system potassium uptake protein
MGARPIRQTWFVIVLPALLLSYLGQGALLLEHPELAANPFFKQAPAWALLPLLALATLAAIIASQAVVTGAFSITWQAMQLGYLPRMEVRHTSPDERGQIYIPAINHALLVITVVLVLVFQTSSALAAAYGVAVTATMGITTVLLVPIMRRHWHWPLVATAGTALVFLAIDLAFFGANILKLFDGGWVPLAMGVAVFTVMTTWRTGRRILADRLTEKTVPLGELTALLHDKDPLRAPGTTIFLSAGGNWAPPALVSIVRQLRTLSERVVVFCVHFEEIPWVAPNDQLDTEELGLGIFRVTAHCGFMQRPHVPSLLQACAKRGLAFDLDRITYVLGRENVLATERPGMAIWRENLFATMSRNAGRAAEHFGIPAAQIIEVGTQIEL